MYEQITSLQNPQIKNVVKLQEKASERRKQNLIVVEGEIEITLVFKAKLSVKTIFFCKELASEEKLNSLLELSKEKVQVVEISKAVFQKIAYREGSTGLLALTKPVYTSLEKLKLSENPLLIILEAVEKPGNLGAILRTADASGVDAVIVCDPHTDIYNPNVIRSSIGCVFTKPTVACTSDECIAFLRKSGIKIYSTALTASWPYTEIDFKEPSAIVMGTEATGLSDKWLESSDQNIIIPMKGDIDSMNVSVATAVVIFEAVRQRDIL